ncbi:MAG: hypothetical protein ACM3VV_01350 [Deltaproteobacteria bacterium]|jgi:hypothetical protein|nr:hypothetical protein [Nitrososphaeraceae archaeon]
MFLFGIGFRNTSQRKYGTKEKEDSSRIYCVDETLLKVSYQFVGVWIAIDST